MVAPKIELDTADLIEAVTKQRDYQATEAAMFMAACAGYRKQLSAAEARIAELEKALKPEGDG